MRILLFLSFFQVLVTLTTCQFEETDDKQVYYQIPNPFESAKATKSNGYYVIKSYQTTMSSHKTRVRTYVEEYVSLSLGVTFSFHQNRDDKSQSYLLINDGLNGRYYIVRNLKLAVDDDEEDNAANDRRPENDNPLGERINLDADCELDHLHHHRRIFPWQFVFDIKEEPTTKGDKRNRRGKKSKWNKKRSVYGVAGIWLNAIDRKIVSKQIGDESPYAWSNLWVMNDADIEVKLIFKKPKETAEAGEATQKLLNLASLDSIQLTRTPMLESDPDSAVTTVPDSLFDNIAIKSFESNVDKSKLPFLDQFRYQLARCKQDNKARQLFPSLLHEVNMAPGRMYSIDYVEHKYGAMAIGIGEFDDIKHRHVQDVEYHSEWLSFPLETQVTIYDSVPDLPDPDNHLHVFIKRFTERAGAFSTKHSTAHYHLIEGDDGLESCKPNESDPLPHWFHLFMRPIRFFRPGGIHFTGTLTGIGALLMNAADTHYKQFSLFKKKISIPFDVVDLHTKQEILTDEWKIIDDKSGRSVHFFFKMPESDFKDHRIGDLVRIDIRDLMAAEKLNNEGELEDSTPVFEKQDEYDLLMRYDIVKIRTIVSQERINSIFSKPEICGPNQAPVTTREDEENYDADVPDRGEIFDPKEDGYQNLPSDNDETDDERDNENNQNDGENLEFEPGTLADTSTFPDFWDFIDGSQSEFSMISKIEILTSSKKGGDTNEGEAKKFIYLREMVGFKTNLARISIFYSDSNLDAGKPDLDYFINYNSEIMLQYTGSDCKVVDEFEPWLRLFSSQVSYYRTNEDSTATIESDKVRLYGVSALWRQASESLYTFFLGSKRQPVDIKGNTYKELYWSLTEDNDMNMELRFKFLLDLTPSVDDVEWKNILSLHSIYIDTLFGDDEYGGNFKRFIINEPTILHNQQVSLPVSCRNVLLEHKSGSYVSVLVELPDFEKFIKSSYGYTAHYSVTQSIDKPQASEKQSISSYWISEYYDANLSYGKFTVGFGEDTREIFINGTGDSIYLYARQTCKRVTNLKGLIDSDSQFLAGGNEDKIFGLAQLLTRFSKQNNFILEVENRHDKDGNKYERRIYRNKGDIITSRLKKVIYDVELVYMFRPESKINAGDYVLESIDFSPRFSTEKKKKDLGQKLHRTNIRIGYLNGNSRAKKFSLPDECMKLQDEQKSPAEESDLRFPKLSVYSSVSGFHIRSEITCSTPFPGEMEKVFLLDEWKLANDLRMTTHGLRNNFDIMIYANTKETFDLSKDFRCSNYLPSIFSAPSNYGKTSLLDLYANNKSNVETLSELYYSPLALWTLAENNPNIVTLSSSADLAPMAKSGTQTDMLDREMRSETWLVKQPLTSWFYEMNFEKYSKTFENGDVMTWHVLSSIKISPSTSESTIYLSSSLVEVKVVNYRYRNDMKEMRDKLKLPQGHGCVRTKEVEAEHSLSVDDLLLDKDIGHYIWYEASLERISRSYGEDGDPEAVTRTRKTLPTVVGTYTKSGYWIKTAPYIDVHVNYASIRHLDGSRTAMKTVVDELSDLTFRIDRNTGQCSVTRREVTDWTFEFPEDDGVHKLYVDDYMFQALFSPKSAVFNSLNRYVDDKGYLISEYEDYLHQFKLTNKLEGPVSIVRRFEVPENAHVPMVVKGVNIIKLHSAVSVKVLMFNQLRTKVEAILNFNLRQIAPINVSELFDYTDVSACYNDGTRKMENQIRSFTLEYQCQNPNWLEYDAELVKNTFMINLIIDSQILPTQYSGTPTMDHTNDGKFKFNFNLLEAPTSLEYNTKYLPYSRMNLELEYKAEVKLVNNIWDCSKWCDMLDCIAMSHCVDHTCRVITPSMLLNGTDRLYPLKTEIRKLTDVVQDADCSYLYRLGKRPRTVDNFADYMNIAINLGKNHSRLQIDTGKFCDVMIPSKFYEIEDQFNSIAEDSSEISVTYVELKQDYKLDLEKITMLKSNFKGSVKQAESSYSDCMEACKSEECIVFSYCKQQKSCLTVSGSGDLRSLEDVFEPAMGSGCVISAQNFLERYIKFEYTKPPIEVDTRIENYSALECAAMCETVDGHGEYDYICLSFDICVDKDGSSSTCYLHKEHVMQDSFDRRILDPKSFNDSTTIENPHPDQMKSCQHYSKSILADFTRLPIKRYTIEDDQLVRGSSAEKCALMCKEDDECYAFDYCFDDRNSPAQACYFIRSNNDSSPNFLKHLQVSINLLSKPDIRCSIYVLRQLDEQYTTIEGSHVALWREMNRMLDKHSNLLASILKFVYHILCSLIIGGIIQLAYIKLLGRPLAITVTEKLL